MFLQHKQQGCLPVQQSATTGGGPPQGPHQGLSPAGQAAHPLNPQQHLSPQKGLNSTSTVREEVSSANNCGNITSSGSFGNSLYHQGQHEQQQQQHEQLQIQQQQQQLQKQQHQQQQQSHVDLQSSLILQGPQRLENTDSGVGGDGISSTARQGLNQISHASLTVPVSVEENVTVFDPSTRLRQQVQKACMQGSANSETRELEDPLHQSNGQFYNFQSRTEESSDPAALSLAGNLAEPGLTPQTCTEANLSVISQGQSSTEALLQASELASASLLQSVQGIVPLDSATVQVNASRTIVQSADVTGETLNPVGIQSTPALHGSLPLSQQVTNPQGLKVEGSEFLTHSSTPAEKGQPRNSLGGGAMPELSAGFGQDSISQSNGTITNFMQVENDATLSQKNSVFSPPRNLMSQTNTADKILHTVLEMSPPFGSSPQQTRGTCMLLY